MKKIISNQLYLFCFCLTTLYINAQSASECMLLPEPALNTDDRSDEPFSLCFESFKN